MGSPNCNPQEVSLLPALLGGQALPPMLKLPVRYCCLQSCMNAK